MRLVRTFAGLLACLCLMGQGLVQTVPPAGLVQAPTTVSSIGGAGAMASACPAGQALSQITSTTFTCINPVGVPPGTGTITDAMLANPYSGVGACAVHMWASTLTRNLAPTCTQPAFADLTGTATDAQLANAYSGIGTCTAGQYVNALARNGAPTCSTPATGSFAPLTNPAGGQNNYAPLASPSFTGTITFPDASTYTTAGHNSMKALGIGQAIGTDPLDVTGNVNGNTAIDILNNSTGVNTQSAFMANNGTHYIQYGVTGTAYTAGGSAIPADSGLIYSNNNGGVVVYTSNGSFNPPIVIYVNGVKTGTFSAGATPIVTYGTAQQSDFSAYKQWSCHNLYNGMAVNATQNLVGVNNWGVTSSGLLTVNSSLTGGGALTIKTYTVALMGGGGTAAGNTLANVANNLNTNNYGTPAPFTLNENPASPNNVLYVTNTATTPTNLEYWYTQTGGSGGVCF